MALGAKAIFYSSLDLKYLAGSDTQQVCVFKPADRSNQQAEIQTDLTNCRSLGLDAQGSWQIESQPWFTFFTCTEKT